MAHGIAARAFACVMPVARADALSAISPHSGRIFPSKEFFRFALQLLQNAHLVATLRVLQCLSQGMEQGLSGYFTLKELLKGSHVLF
ncbi:MAG TPA: hypothetical protein VGI36_13665 [Candidatus Binataceae bacterium]